MDKANFLKAVKDEKDSTIVENQWTKDGVEHFGYGGYSRGLDNEDIEFDENDLHHLNQIKKSYEIINDNSFLIYVLNRAK